MGPIVSIEAFFHSMSYSLLQCFAMATSLMMITHGLLLFGLVCNLPRLLKRIDSPSDSGKPSQVTTVY